MSAPQRAKPLRFSLLAQLAQQFAEDWPSAYLPISMLFSVDSWYSSCKTASHTFNWGSDPFPYVAVITVNVNAINGNVSICEFFHPKAILDSLEWEKKHAKALMTACVKMSSISCMSSFIIGNRGSSFVTLTCVSTLIVTVALVDSRM